MATTPSPTPTPSTTSNTTRPEPAPVEESKLPVFGERRPDAMEQAIIDGKVTDSEGKPISAEAVKPVIPHILDEGEQQSKKGELKTGDIGYVPLDEQGRPTGPATKFPPRDKPAAPVATVIPSTPRILATPAGAHLTDGGMQPSPHTNKYKTAGYNRDYKAIFEAVNKRDGNIIAETK